MARIRKSENDPMRSRETMAKHLRNISGQGDRSVGTPTPERALKANGSMRQGMDKVIRIEDTPLDKLAAHHKLAPRDPRLNAILRASGEQYYRDWYLSGLCSIQAVDPSRIQIDGGGIYGPGLPTAANAQDHLRRWQKAMQAVVAVPYGIGPRLLQVLDALILKEETLLLIGRRVTGYSSKDAPTAVALERLVLALMALAVHYGFVDER